jgi:hypothetical protein
MFVSFPVAFNRMDNPLSYWQDDDNLIFLLQEEKWEILHPYLHMDGTLTLTTYQKNNKRFEFRRKLCCKFGLSGVR